MEPFGFFLCPNGEYITSHAVLKVSYFYLKGNQIVISKVLLDWNGVAVKASK